MCVEFAGKISRGGVRSATGLLAALCRAAGIAVLVTDEIARETAARGGYSGPWPHRAAGNTQTGGNHVAGGDGETRAEGRDVG
ncbi:hypothetical protein [Thiolapillus sp.]|uniref:hypothetical protein n=1 Tax=Thiolapillus sp. TaxID=2017437 RepID=UPI003AF48A70